jgi:hypothetical protein
VTRKSKREIERDLERLDGGSGDPGLEILKVDDRTGEYIDPETGEPTEPDPNKQTLTIRSMVVEERSEALRKGYEILGPAEGDDIPDGRDLVRVASDSVREAPDDEKGWKAR